MAIFAFKPAPTKWAETDNVYPLHFMESSLLVQGSNMAVPLVFPAVLDPEVLRDALETLVKRDGWTRLGGRLRKNAASKIEWHIPTVFSASRPAITYAHVDHACPIAAYSVVSTIPTPSSRPAVVGNPELLRELAWGPGVKLNGINDYLTVDKPVLGLRVNSFTDATIVVLTWQHVAFDALGMQYVIEGWRDVLHGRADSIPTPWPIEKDPFEKIEKGTNQVGEEHVLAGKRVGMGGLLRWGLGYGFDMLARAKDNRMMCVPESYWRPQLDLALRELREEAVAKCEDPGKVFLTENDVVTAFLMRSVVKAERWSDNRTVASSIAMSLRKAFEPDLIPPASKTPIVGNAFGWSNILLTAGTIAKQPLSIVAAAVRRAINEQGTRAQHEAYYTMVRQSGMGLPIIVFGDGGMAQLGFSNWSKAGLFDLDFSPARKDGLKGSCCPVYAQVNNGPIKPGDGFFVLGKDKQGNYWAQGDKVKGQWDRLAKVLDEEFGKNEAV